MCILEIGLEFYLEGFRSNIHSFFELSAEDNKLNFFSENWNIDNYILNIYMNSLNLVTFER